MTERSRRQLKPKKADEALDALKAARSGARRLESMVRVHTVHVFCSWRE